MKKPIKKRMKIVKRAADKKAKLVAKDNNIKAKK